MLPNPMKNGATTTGNIKKAYKRILNFVFSIPAVIGSIGIFAFL
jgi:hypothetical protein